MRDLAEMYPQVRSVSVVPVGLTKYREGLYHLTPFTPESAAELISQVEAFADSCLAKHGSRILFCSDELYIKAGKELPPDEYYEDHIQLENGVGMIRLLETEFRSALSLADEPDGKPFSIVAGEAAAPYLAKLLGEAQSRFPALQGRVYAVKNDFFGPEINVTGLITGGDMIRQLQGKPLGERLIISQNMLRHPEMDFLDDVPIRQAEQELGLRIVPVRQDGFELLDAMFGLVEEFPDPAEGEDTDYYRYNK
jgi:NifB/MoaA-like Fe-S oxidoreductase